MLRVVTELVSSGEQVTAIVNPASRHYERIAELGAQMIGVRVVSESVLRRAGIDSDETASSARALVLLDADDVHNVHTALTARDMDHDLRIVVVAHAEDAVPGRVAAAIEQEPELHADLAEHEPRDGRGDEVVQAGALAQLAEVLPHGRGQRRE